MPMERSPRRKATRDAPGTQFEEHLDAPHEVERVIDGADRVRQRYPASKDRSAKRGVHLVGRGQSGAGDGNRTRVTSLEGASGQSFHA
jgi:hypothetical protein